MQDWRYEITGQEICVSEIPSKRQGTYASEGMCRNSSVFRNGCRCRNSKLCRNSWGCLRLSGRRLQDRRYVPEIAGKRQDTHASEITSGLRKSSAWVRSHKLSKVSHFLILRRYLPILPNGSSLLLGPILPGIVQLHDLSSISCEYPLLSFGQTLTAELKAYFLINGAPSRICIFCLLSAC